MHRARISIIISFCISLMLASTAKAQSVAGTAQTSMKKADSLYFARDWAGARKLYSKLLGDTSHNSIAWNRLGFSDYNTGDYDAAMKSYLRALSLNPITPVKASAYS